MSESNVPKVKCLTKLLNRFFSAPDILSEIKNQDFSLVDLSKKGTEIRDGIKVQNRLKKVQLFLSVLFGIIFFLVLIPVLDYQGEIKNRILLYLGIFGFFLCFMYFVLSYDLAKITLRDYEHALFYLSEESILLSLKESKSSLHAIRQYLNQQSNIDIYHKSNQKQQKNILRLGLGIIIFGGLVIIVSLAYGFGFLGQNVELIPVVSGIISGVLVDFIGAIFIVMYSKTMDATQKYYAGSRTMLNAHYGNVLTTKIDNRELQEETLSSMAIELAKLSKPDY